MKKVLLAAYACSPVRGSEENNGWCWATGLAQRGYAVWCLTNMTDKKEIEERHMELKMPNLHFVFVPLPFGLDEKWLDPSAKTIYLHYWLWKKRTANIAKKLHEREGFDVAHHVTYGSFQQGSCLYKLTDCKLIFGPVGGGQMALPIFRDYFGNSWRTEKMRRCVSDYLLRYSKNLKRLLTRADSILTVNRETFDMLGQMGKDFHQKGHMVMDAALPNEYRNMSYVPKPPKKTLRILWLGRLLPRKGLNLTFHALSYLKNDLDYQLTVVGGGEQERFVDQWMDKYGLDRSKIHMVGQVPFAKVESHYKNSDVMVFCSLRDTSGNQVIEAMAHGLPVIVLNISGMVSMVPENCGIKVNPTTKEGTAQDIAKAIERMCTDTAYRMEAGKNAYQYAMGFTWADKIDHVISKFY
ncbi:MAG: glycosyltransferase family 4 protein [Flavobacteriaceae bacterium]